MNVGDKIILFMSEQMPHVISYTHLTIHIHTHTLTLAWTQTKSDLSKAIFHMAMALKSLSSLAMIQQDSCNHLANHQEASGGWCGITGVHLAANDLLNFYPVNMKPKL